MIKTHGNKQHTREVRSDLDFLPQNSAVPGVRAQSLETRLQFSVLCLYFRESLLHLLHPLLKPQKLFSVVEVLNKAVS